MRIESGMSLGRAHADEIFTYMLFVTGSGILFFLSPGLLFVVYNPEQAATLFMEWPCYGLLFWVSCSHGRQLPLFSYIIKPAQKALGRDLASLKVEYSS